MSQIPTFEYYFYSLIHKIIQLYYRFSRYLYFSNFRKKHILFSFQNNKLQITTIDHPQFIRELQNKINKFPHINNYNLIKFSLTEALHGANFVTISDKNNDNLFIQIWTGEHTLKFDFYANKKNKLTKYYYPLLGLFSEQGFVGEKNEVYRGWMVYKVKKDKNIINITINFYNDIPAATDFIDKLFTNIFKTISGDLKVIVA